MKAKLLTVINLGLTLLLIYWNYLSNTGFIEGKTIGSLSKKYDSLFTPASYAFSIWGLIFLGLIIFSVFATYLAFRRPDKYHYVKRAVPFMILTNLLNGAWVYLWLTENILASVVCMVLIFLSLLKIIINIRMELWDAPLKIIALVWWPVDFYFGWIQVALIANIAAYLSSIHFSAGLQEQTWTVVLIGAVMIINLLLIWKRNLREVAIVAIWALKAIAVRHWDSEELIVWAAILGTIILMIANQLHAYKNRSTLPFFKKKWSEAI